MSQDKNSQVVNYDNYAFMLLDFSKLSKDLDLDKTLAKAPDFSFYKKDGSIHLGSSFQHMILNMIKELRIEVNPQVSRQHMGMYTVVYDNYAPVENKELPKQQVKAVDTPARKRASRTKAEV